MTFGDYASFLEISFAVNLIFAAWGSVWEWLSTTLNELRRRAESKSLTEGKHVGRVVGISYDQVGTTKRYKLIKSVRAAFRQIAWLVAIAVAGTIMGSLFFVPADTQLSTGQMWLIGLTPFAELVLMLIMVIVDFILYGLLIMIPNWWFNRGALKALKRTSSIEPPTDDQP